MLNQFYKFVLVNNSGQTITHGGTELGTVKLKLTGVYVTPSTGKLAYANLGDDDFGFDGVETILNGGEVLSTEVDNGTPSLYINVLAQVEVQHDEGAAADTDSTFDLYYTSGDASGELETDASGYDTAETSKLTFIGSLTLDANLEDDQLVRSSVFTI